MCSECPLCLQVGGTPICVDFDKQTHWATVYIFIFKVGYLSKSICLDEGSQVAQMVKNTPANAGDVGLIPGSGRSPGEGNGNPLQYSCLENPMDRGAWQTTVSPWGWDLKESDTTAHTHTHLQWGREAQELPAMLSFLSSLHERHPSVPPS